MVQGEGFEPPKAEPDDLQSPVFDRFTNPAKYLETNLRVFLNAPAKWNIFCWAALFLGYGPSYQYGADRGIRTHDPLFTKQPL